MVLVDTSVWIRAFMNSAPFASGLDHLLKREEVAGHIFVYGELVIGDLGGRKKHLLAYRAMRQAILVPDDEVLAFVAARHLNGRGLSWIDAHLLASALTCRMQVWTADVRFAEIAAELGIGFEPRFK
jgi:predicted nucleic acid-binding protein